MMTTLLKYALFLSLGLLIQVTSIESCLEEERLALVEINAYMKSYADPNNVSPGIGNNYDDHDCCGWERVRCNPTSDRVVEMYLGSMVTTNTSWSFNLTFFKPFVELISLDLSRNSLNGLVEKDGSIRISTLRNVQVLKLNGNYFEAGQIKLGSLTSLNKLDLSDCGLDESILPAKEIANLTELRELDLSRNTFQDIVQELRNLRNLRVLDVSNNLRLNGSIQGLCELKSLEELYFQNNQYHGEYPSCVSNLTSLRIIDMSKNSLVGNLSLDAFANLNSLMSLDLSDNRIEGNWCLSSLANHSKLEVLRLSGNRVVVQTKDSFWEPTFQLHTLDLKGCNLSEPITNIGKILSYQYNLRDIGLSHNRLVGNFPAWLINNNSQLKTLSLESNRLSGYIQFHNISANVLQDLDISDNDLQGALPGNISLMLPELVQLNMSMNNFEGKIPASMGKLAWLETLDLSDNNFSGELPTQLLHDCNKLSNLILSDNHLQGDIISEHMNLTGLFVLKLKNNNFSGKMKDSLLRSRGLNHLDISGNNVIGELPSWIGGFCTLVTLLMSKNLLNGLIPTEICQIPLTCLDLSLNNFMGTIPSCLSSPTILLLANNLLTGSISNALSGRPNIEMLDLTDNYLTGSIPPWINKLYGLQLLFLGGNNLQGQIPQELCELQGIYMLHLSRNKLSGRIPACLGNMMHGFRERMSFKKNPFLFTGLDPYIRSLQAALNVWVHFEQPYNTLIFSLIDLSYNNFTGVIPPELGNLDQITFLKLSCNSLSGSIPSSFGNLKQIEALDLSFNKLSGSIPSGLTKLHFLEVFNVSYNNLTGKTPQKNQFATFDESSYLGNPELCVSASQKCSNLVQPIKSFAIVFTSWVDFRANILYFLVWCFLI